MENLKESKVLIVDDVEANIDLLVRLLGDTYQLQVALNGKRALACIEKDIPDLILLDIMMPEMDGYEVCETLKAQEKTKDIPIIFITALDQLANKTKGFRLGAVDYITKPFEFDEVRARIETHLLLQNAKQLLANQNVILEEKVLERTKELNAAQIDLLLTQDVTISCMASLAEHRDPETGHHIKRTQNYVRAIAVEISSYDKYKDVLDNNVIENLYKTAPLHDIGKIGIPDNILLKPGPLSKEEFNEMKRHPTYGRNALVDPCKILGSNSFLQSAIEIAHAHHEKWDGSGYPLGLKGEEIPLPGRIMAIADVYDALISKRVYKEAFSHEKTCELIVKGKGSQFDPDLIDAFLKIEDKFIEIADNFAD